MIQEKKFVSDNRHFLFFVSVSWEIEQIARLMMINILISIEANEGHTTLAIPVLGKFNGEVKARDFKLENDITKPFFATICLFVQKGENGNLRCGVIRDFS